MNRKINGVSMLELIIAIIFLSVIVLGVNSISYFSHFQNINTSRRAFLQNQLNIVVEHMRNQFVRVIGNEGISGVDSVINTANIAGLGTNAVRAYIDLGTQYVGSPGIFRAGDGRRNTGNDRWIAYRFTGTVAAPNYRILFCSNCSNSTCVNCVNAWEEVAARISGFSFPGKPVGSVLNNNSITATLQACWDPSIAETPDNPCIGTNALINMPSVTPAN